MIYTLIDQLPHVKFCYSGFYVAPAGWKHKHMLLPNYEIMIGISGTYYLNVNGDVYTVAPGNMLVIRPGETVAGEEYCEGETTFHWLHFEAEHAAHYSELELEHFLKQKSDLNEVAVIPRFTTLTDLPSLEILLRQIAALRETDSYTSLPADLLTANLLIQLSNRTALRKASAIEPSLIQQIKAWVQIRTNQNISLADVSLEFNLSKEHISRTFKKYTGITLTQYITKKRIEYSKSLLATGEYTVKQVAHMAGFTDEKYFSYVFSRSQGIPPGAYRRSIGKVR